MPFNNSILFISTPISKASLDTTNATNANLNNSINIEGNFKKPKVIIKETNLKIPFKIKTDDFQILSKIIIFDSNRNSQIVDDIIKEIKKAKCLVLTERKEHVKALSYYLKREFEGFSSEFSISYDEGWKVS